MGYIERLLGENERIVFRTHQHPLVLFRAALGYGIPAGVFIGATIAANLLFPAFALPATVAGLALAFIPLLLLIRAVLRWWNEVYLVTTRRVVQVEGILNKNVLDSSLEKVNDVVLRQSLWGRLFNYGDIEILTGSEIGVNRLSRIADPLRFKQVMLDQKAAMGEHPILERLGGSDTEITIAQLEALRRSGLLSDQEFEEKRQALLKRAKG